MLGSVYLLRPLGLLDRPAVEDHAEHGHEHAGEALEGELVAEVEPTNEEHAHCLHVAQHLEGSCRELADAQVLAEVAEDGQGAGEEDEDLRGGGGGVGGRGGTGQREGR